MIKLMCNKCQAVFKVERNINKCPKCGSLNIHKIKEQDKSTNKKNKSS